MANSVKAFLESPKGLKKPALWLLAWLVLWLAVFWESIVSAVEVWIITDVYNHCILVLPIAFYFIWEKRWQLSLVAPKPVPILVLPMFAVMMLWLVGTSVHINLFQHVAIFLLLQLSMLSFGGWAVARVLWFPLAFIIFAIPVGDELTPKLQQITADFSVIFLKWSGIPVFRQGLYLSIPEGDFEVAEACSGISFLIASVMLGVLYAYLNFRSLKRRLAFILLSLLLPIFANGVRAYGIIMIGHYSNMTLAVGADHLIYGWFFFAFVLFLLFFIGHFWTESAVPRHEDRTLPADPAWQSTNWLVIFIAASLPVIGALMIDKVIIKGHESASYHFDDSGFTQALKRVPLSGEWLPQYPEASEVIFGQRYLADKAVDVDYFIAWYPQNIEDKELISYKNAEYRNDRWRISTTETLNVSVSSGKQLRANLLDLVSLAGKKRLVLYWFQLPNANMHRPIMAKLYQALNIVTGKGGAGGIVALSMPYTDDLDHAKQQLVEQAESLLPKVLESIELVVDK